MYNVTMMFYELYSVYCVYNSGTIQYSRRTVATECKKTEFKKYNTTMRYIEYAIVVIQTRKNNIKKNHDNKLLIY